MTVWIAHTAPKSAVLGFKADRDELPQPRVSSWAMVEGVEADARLGIRSQKRWEPQEGYVGRGKPKHFVYMGARLVCNAEAWHLLEDEIKNDVEGLPIIVEGFGLFYGLNVCTLVDCLDREHLRESIARWRAKEIDRIHPKFHEDLLARVMLFRAANDPEMIYATDAFKALAERHRLKDIEFLVP